MKFETTDLKLIYKNALTAKDVERLSDEQLALLSDTPSCLLLQPCILRTIYTSGIEVEECLKLPDISKLRIKT